MKIRNKFDGTIIESPSSIKEEKYFFRLTNLGNCSFLFKIDSWEEVEGETDSADKWHDLRKNPEDLPPHECEASICSINVLIYTSHNYYDIAQYDFTGKDWSTNGGLWLDTSEVIAWREIPKFEEK